MPYAEVGDEVLRQPGPPSIMDAEHIAIVEPVLAEVLDHKAPLLCLYEHASFCEGTVWDAPRTRLVWSDIVGRRVLAWYPDGCVGVVVDRTHFINGNAVDRDGVLVHCDVAAGEYVSTLDDVRAMLAAGAVDVQQADVTRCGGVTGFLRAANLCEAFHTDLSGHCAPAIHLHAACAAPRLRHLERFHDHVRIEALLFDGAPVPKKGVIAPDLSRSGHGLEFRAADARKHQVT